MNEAHPKNSVSELRYYEIFQKVYWNYYKVQKSNKPSLMRSIFTKRLQRDSAALKKSSPSNIEFPKIFKNPMAWNTRYWQY